jgi:VWFA-related protein
MRLCLATCLAMWVVLLASGDARQAPASQQPPRFKSGVEVVELDISVVDNDSHRPVRGLTADDFTVLEDGQPQSIVQFTPVDIVDPPPSPTTWLSDVAPDVKDNTISDRRVFVLLLDDATLPGDPNMVRGVKQAAHALVNRLGPTDLASVVFTSNNSHAQDFTSDRQRLNAAIDTFAAGFRGMQPPPMPPQGAAPNLAARGAGGLSGVAPLPDKNVDTYFYQSSVSTLERVAESLTYIPHQRKILMYISIGVPMPGLLTYESFGSAQDTMSGAAGQLKQQISELFRLARLSNVNVYSFNPAGLDGLANYFQTHPDPSGDVSAHTDFLRVVAAETGGRAVLDTNSLEQGVVEMVRESGSYYLIAYQSSNPRQDGKYRKVDVRVGRPNVTVRTRSGYNAPKAASGAKPAPPPAELSGLSRGDVQMQVTMAPFAVPGKDGAAIVIAADVHQPTPPQRTADNVELRTSAYGAQGGKAVAFQNQVAKVVMRPTPDEPDAQFEVLSRLDVKPGHYNVRIGAHSMLLDKAGSVYDAIDVPDFEKDPLSLSGVVISAAPPIASAGKEALATLLPVMPTTRRTFTKADRVTGFLRVYQHAKGTLSSVRLDIRVVDDHDNAAFHATQTLSADQFEPVRAVDQRFDVPVATFAPGPHLLTIEATAGKATARRDVRFVVR